MYNVIVVLVDNVPLVFFYFSPKPFKKQDACTGVHSACRREENGHNLCVLHNLRLVYYAVHGSARGRCRDFLVLKWGGGLNLQIWDLNRAHETERTVFPILQVFSMCRCKL